MVFVVLVGKRRRVLRNVWHFVFELLGPTLSRVAQTDGCVSSGRRRRRRLRRGRSATRSGTRSAPRRRSA